ncbi:MAG: hypothetical protein ACFFCF_04325 [Promethearchaeota archaeon]
MALGGFDFLAAEKDTTKKIEELANVLERVATIFLNGVGSLEKQMDELRNRLAIIETQVDTVLRMGGPKTAPTTPSAATPPPSPMEAPRSPGMPQSPAGPSSPPGIAAPPPQAPTSPMGAAASGGLGIRAQMQGELQSFLARRRAALESMMENEE